MPEQYNAVIARVMNGAIDTHLHNGPEGELERRQDVLEAAQRAHAQGMRAVVLKNKEYSTAPLAYLVNKLVPGFTAVGAIVCDLYVGGLNPLAVDMALRQGARVVWMPTWTGAANLDRFGLRGSGGEGRTRGVPIGAESLRRIGDGIRLVDGDGRLLPVVHEILDLAAQHRAVIQSGHIGTDELIALVKATRERRLDLICTHANFLLTPEEQRELAAPDVLMEHCNVTVFGGRQSYEQLAGMIRAVGAQHCVLGTDLGQFNNPYPVEGYRSFIAGLLLNGFSEDELVTVAQRNAARVLRLEDGGIGAQYHSAGKGGGVIMPGEQNYWTKRMSRRRALQLAAAGGVLAACSSPDTSGGPSTGAQRTAPGGAQAGGQAATPTRGGRIVRSVAGDPVSFDPHATISYLTVEFIDFFHAKLVRYDYRTTPPYRNGDEDRIMGELADRWESPEPRTWIFQLKRGMKYHDKPPVSGREVVADDVKWSWERALSPGHQVEEWAWNNYDKIEVVDPYTVRFTLKQPNGRLPVDLAAYQTWVLPREADEKIGFKKMEGSTIGAGPWLFDSYQPGSKWVAKKNPNYGPFPGHPNADEIHVPIMTAQDARTTAFRGRQIDLHAPLPQEVSSIKASNPDVKWKEDILLATNTWMLCGNVQEKPFDDVRVRRALSLAIDREAWLKSPNLSRGKVESGPVTWGMGDWKLPPEKHGEVGQWLKYDVTRAKQLLAAAGYPDGFETTLNQTPQYGASYMTEAELLQEFLAKAGIKVSIKNVEYSQWISQHYTGKYSGLFWGPDNLDRLTQQFLSRYASWSTRNHPNVKDPEVDRRLAEWRAIGDLQKAKEAAWELQKFFADQAYAVYRPQPYSSYAWQPYLKNYEGETEFLYDYGFRSIFLWTDPVQRG